MDFVYGALFIFAVFFVLFGLLVEFLEMLGELIGDLLFYLTQKLTDGLILLFVYLLFGLRAASRHTARAVLRWGPPLGRGAARYARHAWQHLKAAAVFLFFLADEAVRGPRPDATQDDAQEEPAQDPYQAALNLLGLPTDCSREELARAYKRAISRAHPDKGGTHQQAMAVNTAREIIMNRNGWRK